MGSQTPTFAIPYPVGTDRVADGDNAMQAIAERVEALLAGTAWVAITLGAGVAAVGGFAAPRASKIGNLVVCQGLVSGPNPVAQGSIFGVLPVGYRPAGHIRFVTQMAGSGGGQVGVLNVDANGSIQYESSGVSGNVLACSFAPIVFRVG